jgi:predicted protein tyrosine phosphatase
VKSVLDDDSGKPILYVGSDDDYADAAKRGFAILSAAKDGPHGHRSMLGYGGMSAPKNSNYLHVESGQHLALNLIDSEDPDFIPEAAIETGLRFIHKHIQAGDRVLVHCNAGLSRSPIVAMLFLRSVGELPSSFLASEKVFRSLYSSYQPAHGVRAFARANWKKFGQFKY